MKPLMQIAAGALVATSFSASAATVSWTDWTSAPDPYTAIGSLQFGSTTVGVNYSSNNPYSFVQTGSGTNYWTGSAYTNGSVSNAPTPAELIALDQDGTITITFSQSVLNPLIAITSWNGNTVDFGVPITVDSNGAGYWGSGILVLNVAGTGFWGDGEVHGIIKLTGSYTSITFSHTSENWHGFTVGASSVPLPAAFWLFGSGVIGLFGLANRNRLS